MSGPIPVTPPAATPSTSPSALSPEAVREEVEKAFAAAAGSPADASISGDFPATAPAANPVFYRTYSRKTPSGRESWHQVAERNLGGLKQLGNLND